MKYANLSDLDPTTRILSPDCGEDAIIVNVQGVETNDEMVWIHLLSSGDVYPLPGDWIVLYDESTTVSKPIDTFEKFLEHIEGD